MIFCFLTYFMSKQSQTIFNFLITLFLQIFFHVIKTVKKLEKSYQTTYDLMSPAYFYYISVALLPNFRIALRTLYPYFTFINLICYACWQHNLQETVLFYFYTSCQIFLNILAMVDFQSVPFCKALVGKYNLPIFPLFSPIKPCRYACCLLILITILFSAAFLPFLCIVF